MKFSTTIFTAFTVTGANADLWNVPGNYTTNAELQGYFRAFPGCVGHCSAWYQSPAGGSRTDTGAIRMICETRCRAIFGMF
ncbi:hypothetical protein M0657_010919 [Pyricularia oryzae]|uniref:WSC domain-containing protein n=2 Tax=Pyricularia oryzae TaxID=318829 RepID=A0AA97PJW6_PYRO3|nr:hypothetical protein OOU_Y34scaffold00595g2 [Pyricularia oryzae Y34]KAI7911511.1 hypothetical protein M0657_010919 [Pyricularia oryzae]KAI7912011.1 hypothetical protein M9X92_010251 [Pyricularia oryzae]